MDILKKLEMEMALKEIKANMPVMIDYGIQMSKLLKKYYDALLKEGFTEEQALKIAIAHGPTYGTSSNNQE